MAAAGALFEFLSRQKGIRVQTTTSILGLEDVDCMEDFADDDTYRFDVRGIECLSLSVAASVEY